MQKKTTKASEICEFWSIQEKDENICLKFKKHLLSIETKGKFYLFLVFFHFPRKKKLFEKP